MKALVTGAGGQLGRELLREAPLAGVEASGRTRHELDVTSATAVEEAVAGSGAEVVVHAAAYTAVDRAESEPDRAFVINATGTEHVARAAAAAGARLIHLSTDFVFDGARARPYPPAAPTAPLGVYGHSKLKGERAALEHGGKAVLVLRTAWLYSALGGNFPRTILGALSAGRDLEVVADQVGSPTWARGLAQAIWRAAREPSLTGVRHWTDAGVASWYDFAVAVQEEAGALGLIDRPVTIRPVTTASRPTPARRPAFSVLDTTATYAALGLAPRHWRAQLRDMLAELAAA